MTAAQLDLFAEPTSPTRCACTRWAPGERFPALGMVDCASCGHWKQSHRNAGAFHSPCDAMAGAPSGADIAAEIAQRTDADELPTWDDDEEPAPVPDRPLTLETLADAVPEWLKAQARAADTNATAVQSLRHHLNGGQSWDDRGHLVWLPQPHLRRYGADWRDNSTNIAGPTWAQLAEHLRHPPGLF